MRRDKIVVLVRNAGVKAELIDAGRYVKAVLDQASDRPVCGGCGTRLIPATGCHGFVCNCDCDDDFS